MALLYPISPSDLMPSAKEFDTVSSLLHSGVDVEIKTTRPCYTFGSTVQGSVVLRARRRAKHCGIYIKCDCLVAVYHDSESDKRALTNTRERDEAYIPPGVLETGTTEFTFEFVLSQCPLQTCVIPGRLGTNRAEVVHRISVMVVSPNSIDLHATKKFVVQMPYKLAPVKAYYECYFPYYLHSDSKGPTVELSLDNEAFQTGDNISVKINMDCTKVYKSIESANLILEQRIAVHFSKTDDIKIQQIASSENLQFPKDIAHNRTVDIKIPIGIPPSVKFDTFSCTYHLVLQVKPMKITKLPDIELPVRIGLCERALRPFPAALERKGPFTRLTQ